MSSSDLDLEENEVESEQEKRKRSNWWRYFEKNSENGSLIAKCKFCPV